MGKFKTFIKSLSWRTFLNRLREPSTYAGFSGAMMAFGVSNPRWLLFSTTAAGIFSLLAALIPEQTKK